MFYAGFSRLDITPPLGIPLTGYYRNRYADGILDPLELNTVAISDGENTLLILSLDLIEVKVDCADEIRAMISEKTGVPVDGILLHCLHQHTAPHVGKGPSIPLVDYLQDKAYLDLLYRKLCDGAVMALADRKEAKVSVTAGDTLQPLSFIRRFRMKDGSTRTNPGCMNPDVVGPIGEADNSLRLIRFDREGGESVAIAAFSTHQDTVDDKFKYSADWGGAFRRQAEAAIPEMKLMVMSGFQGDVNHVDVNHPAEAYEDPCGHCKFMGKVLTDTLLTLWDKTRPVAGEKVWSRVVAKNVPTNTQGIERAEECMEIYRKSMNKTLGYKLEMGEKADMGRIGTLPRAAICQKMVVSLFGIGDAAILGVGGEPFTHYALEAREAAGDVFLMTVCLANAAEAYFPTKEAFDEGGYEARTSRMSAECAPLLSQTNRALLEEYQNFLKS